MELLRPIRFAAVPSRRVAQGDKKGTHMCHPELCEGSLWKYRQNLNRDPSKAREDLPCLQGVKRVRCNRRHMGAYPPCVISKAREDLPCLQRVKRARRNRRRMGVCPWQLVAESASFSAADYRAQASGEIFGKILREFYTVCLAIQTAYSPRAAEQRPVRRRAQFYLACKG